MRSSWNILAMLAFGGLLGWGQSEFSFPKVKLVGEKGSAENAQLVFLPAQHLITIHSARHAEISVPYGKISKLSYWRSERNQTAKKVAVGAVTYGLGALLISKAPQYHFYLDYEEQGAARQVELLLDPNRWEEVLQVARAETGREVVIAGAATPPAAASAAQPSPPTEQSQAPSTPAAPATPTPAASPVQAATPAPAAAAPAAPAALTLTSTPPGADIQVNGAFAGNTPSTLKLEAGNYTIAVEKAGFVSWQRSVTLTAAAAVALDAQLAAAAPSAAAGVVPARPDPARPAPVSPAPAPDAMPTATPAAREPATPDLHPVKQDGHWGYVDSQGQMRVSPQLDLAELFTEGRALVAVAHQTMLSSVLFNGAAVRGTEYNYGWIDESGRTVVRPAATIGGPYSDGLAVSGTPTGSARVSCSITSGSISTGLICTPESRVDFLDKLGNVAVHTEFRQAEKFTEKLAAVAVPGDKPDKIRWGYIDSSGKMAIEPAFLSASPFAEGLAAVHVERKGWGFIDHTGTLVIAPDFHVAENFSEGLADVQFSAPKARTGKAARQAYEMERVWGYIDRAGAHVIPPSFVMAQPFFEGLAAVNTEAEAVPGVSYRKNLEHGKWSFIDHTGRIVIPGPFESAARFSGGLAPVKQNGLWGYIDTTGAFRIQPQFEAAKIFRGELAAVQLGAKWGFIDRSGKFVVAPQFEDAK